MIKDYRALRSQLSPSELKPNPWRFLHIFTLWAVAGTSIALILTAEWAWGWNLVLALLVGHCWGVGGLLAHELMHGSIVRSRQIQNLVSFVLFVPFLISPTFWRFWHNNLHHSHTQRPIVDPDAYPTLRLFKQSRFAQWMYPFTPGSGHLRSYAYLFVWFFVNTQVTQFYFRFRNGAYKKLDHKRVNLELGLILILHTGALWTIGMENWVWIYGIPFLLQNYIPFSYISTNHNLSPLTKVNDPLENSLTVTNHPLLEKLHINFGYHVEHHLFPTMSHSHHKKLHELLKANYPDKYKYMTKWSALKKLYKTPRIYKKHTVLTHPKTGALFGTLGHPLPKSSTDVPIPEAGGTPVFSGPISDIRKPNVDKSPSLPPT